MTTPADTVAPDPRVLIAEDQRVVRRSAARNLRRNGCFVLEADDGQIALDLVATQDIDLAIIDIGLPRVSGLEVVKALKERCGTAVSVLVMSGSVDNQTKVAAFDAGADDFVCKPVYMPELLRRVHAFRRTQLAYIAAEQARQRAEQLNLYASEAAALLAHDLSNGLSIAVGNLDYLVETSEDPDEDRADARVSTLRALRKMSGLVRNFVELRQLEDAALITKPEDTQIAELLQGVADLHKHEVQPKQARIRVECPADLRACVDPVLVERVVHNLVGNAIRYVEPGGSVRLAARVVAGGETPELVLEVGNSGAGIPEALRGKMFEMYGMAGDQNSRRGMGLYFCRLASEAHGGSIAVEPTDEFPANFVVRFLSRAAVAATAAEQEPDELELADEAAQAS